jgi:hypothetical protein
MESSFHTLTRWLVIPPSRNTESRGLLGRTDGDKPDASSLTAHLAEPHRVPSQNVLSSRSKSSEASPIPSRTVPYGQGQRRFLVATATEFQDARAVLIVDFSWTSRTSATDARYPGFPVLFLSLSRYARRQLTQMASKICSPMRPPGSESTCLDAAMSHNSTKHTRCTPVRL